jgi:hypothetical protein
VRKEQKTLFAKRRVPTCYPFIKKAIIKEREAKIE